MVARPPVIRIVQGTHRVESRWGFCLEGRGATCQVRTPVNSGDGIPPLTGSTNDFRSAPLGQNNAPGDARYAGHVTLPLKDPEIVVGDRGAGVVAVPGDLPNGGRVTVAGRENLEEFDYTGLSRAQWLTNSGSAQSVDEGSPANTGAADAQTPANLGLSQILSHEVGNDLHPVMPSCALVWHGVLNGRGGSALVRWLEVALDSLQSRPEPKVNR